MITWCARAAISENFLIAGYPCGSIICCFLQKAICCDQSLCNSHRSSTVNHADHMTRDFTKLMLEGNVRAVVRWVTEQAGGGLLRFSDTIEYSHPQSGTISGTVLDVLCFKHPDPSVPPASISPDHHLIIYFTWKM